MKKNLFLVFMVILGLFFLNKLIPGQGNTGQSGDGLDLGMVSIVKKSTCFKPNNVIHSGIKRIGQVYQGESLPGNRFALLATMKISQL